MDTRRALITSLALTLPALALGAAGSASSTANSAFKNCERQVTGPTAHRFPQVTVTDQHGQKSWFYEQLIHDRLVLVNFTSSRGEKHYPILNNMVKVQNMIGDRLGKDVFMYTITTDPYRDTPASLKELAEEHGANWQFLTGDADDIRAILSGFGIRGSINGLAWVGNERTGRWLTKASRQHALFIAEAVARLSTGKHFKPFLVDLQSV